MTEIRRGLAAQHAHARGLADPVRTEEANDFPFLRDRDAEESEGVLPVLVDEVFLERFRKADNPNRIEGTFLDTDPAADAGFLADRCLRSLRINPDDLGPSPLRRAERDALEMTALGLAPILEDDRDAHCDSMRSALFKRMNLERVSAEPLSEPGQSIAL